MYVHVCKECVNDMEIELKIILNFLKSTIAVGREVH